MKGSYNHQRRLARALSGRTAAERRSRIEKTLANGTNPLAHEHAALKHAVKFGFLECVELLWNAAREQLTTQERFDLLAEAVANNQVHTAKWLHEHGAKDLSSDHSLDLLRSAMNAHGGAAELLDWLLELGLAVDRTNGLTTPLLHLALIHLRETGFPMVRALLDRGCVATDTDENGCTALHAAANYNVLNPDIWHALLDAGCRPDAQDHFGETPRDALRRMGEMPGADANDSNRRQAIMALCEAGELMHTLGSRRQNESRRRF